MVSTIAHPSAPVSPPPAFHGEAEAALAARETALARREARLAEEEALAASRAVRLAAEGDDIPQGPGHSITGAIAPLARAGEDARLRAQQARADAISLRAALLEEREEALRELTLTLERIGHAMTTAREVAAAQEREEAPVGSTATVPDQTPPRPGPDRRTQRRVKVDCDVDMETESNFFSGFAWDISTGGLFVVSFDPLEVGDQVDVRFRLADGPQIAATAVVRWLRESHRLGDLPGAGLQFVDLSDEARSAILTFVEKRMPMFYDT